MYKSTRTARRAVAIAAFHLAAFGAMNLTPQRLSAQEGTPPTPKAGAPASKTIAVDSDQVVTVAYSPDGLLVAGGGSGKNIRLWDPRTGKAQQELVGHRGIVRALAFAPDGRTLVSGGDDHSIRFWDVRTGQLKRTLPKQIGMVSSIVFAPDGKTLATSSTGATDGSRTWTGEIKVWDARTGELLRSRSAKAGSHLSFSPDGRTLASGEGVVKFWDMRSGELTQTLRSNHGAVRLVVFSPDGRTLAGADGYEVRRGEGTTWMSEACLWDTRTGKLRRTLTDLKPWLRSLAFSPDSKVLATGTSGPAREFERVRWETIGGQRFKSITRESRMASEMRLWNVQTGDLFHSVEGSLGEVWSIAFSPDGKTIVSCDDDAVTLTDARTGEWQRTLRVAASEQPKSK
jgi:WD40 repeat protein